MPQGFARSFGGWTPAERARDAAAGTRPELLRHTRPYRVTLASPRRASVGTPCPQPRPLLSRPDLGSHRVQLTLSEVATRGPVRDRTPPPPHRLRRWLAPAQEDPLQPLHPPGCDAAAAGLPETGAPASLPEGVRMLNAGEGNYNTFQNNNV